MKMHVIFAYIIAVFLVFNSSAGLYVYCNDNPDFIVLDEQMDAHNNVRIEGASGEARSTTGPTSSVYAKDAVSGGLDFEFTIPNVPAYIWYRGCGPTAAGMIIGYWDRMGYDDLVVGDASTQTANVNAMMATSDHYNDYSLPIDDAGTGILLDKSSLGGAHSSNCIADWMHTSWSADRNYYGWSWFDMVDDSLTGYVHWAAPQYIASCTEALWSGIFSWGTFVSEIQSRHPMVLCVDSDQDGSADHFVTAIGYGYQGSTNYYACLNTWDSSIHWYEFGLMSTSRAFGIYGAVFFSLPDTVILFQDDFESGGLGWFVGDDDSNCGLDYWGLSTYRAYSGSYSAWCAQVGTYSGNGIANSINHYYDQNMLAFFDRYLPDISGYDSVRLSFYYWATTGIFSIADYLAVYIWNGSWNQIWIQPGVDSNGWQFATMAIPLDSTIIDFYFTSDSTVGFGPYEGVYIDDIVIAALDWTAPSSSVITLPSIKNSASISVAFSASDSGGSDLAYVELYCRLGGTGSYTKYTIVGNPTGHWTSSPISFDSSATGGDGLYQFYTCATDNSGNTEAAPGGYDASTTIDTVSPSTLVHVVGTSGTNGWYIGDSISVDLIATDGTSGVSSISYRIDGGSWQTYSDDLTITKNGTTTIDYFSTDIAGNSETPKSSSFKHDALNPALTITTTNNTLFTSNSVTISWNCTDEISGLNNTKYELDGGSAISCTNGVVQLTGLSDGTHTLTILASDIAGNTIEKTVTFNIDTSVFSFSGPMGPWLDIVLVIVILAIVLTIFFLLKRRKKAGRQEPMPPIQQSGPPQNP